MTDKSLVKNAFYSFMKAFFVFIGPLITFPYASRILGPEGIGVVNFSNSIISYFLIFAGLGIKNYAAREVAKSKENKYELSKFYKEIFLINAISTVIVYIFLFLSVSFIPKLQENKLLIILCSINILFSLFSIDWLFIGLEKFKFTTITSFCTQIFSITLMFLTVKRKENYYQYTFFLTLFPCVVTGLINFIYSFNLIDYKIKFKLNLKKHVPFLFTFFGMAFVSSIYTILDSLMIGFLSSDKELGYYSAATKVNHMVLGLLTSITLILLPRLTNYFKDNKTQFLNLATSSINTILMFSIPIAFGVFLLSDSIILLLSGKTFINAVVPMRIMTPIIIFISISNIIGTQLFPAINCEKQTLISFSLGALVNILFNFILIPIYGAKGAALGTFFAEFTVCIIQICILYKFTKIKLSISQFFQFLTASIIMFLVVNYIQTFITNIILKILISIFLGFITYSFILYILRNKSFKSFLDVIEIKIKDKKNELCNCY